MLPINIWILLLTCLAYSSMKGKDSCSSSQIVRTYLLTQYFLLDVRCGPIFESNMEHEFFIALHTHTKF